MSSLELQREVEAALSDGLSTHDPSSLAAALNNHSLVQARMGADETVDEKMAAALLDAVEANREHVASLAADEIERQINVGPQANAGGQPVAADGGSLISEAGKDTLMMGMIFINGLSIGGSVTGGTPAWSGVVAAVAAALLMAGWFGRKYDVNIDVADK